MGRSGGLSCGCEVLRIRTAHWIRVLGAFSVGMTGSGRVIKSRGVDAEELLEGLGGGWGSANSSNKNDHNTLMRSIEYELK